ncbi:hypothetical protein PR048_031057 [Dryococelus australis]|uniref:Uncharacterized protein n=1 Tax=Dryococelus australis TaxID=614101 RepID=A0ABQ9G4Z4_9NEOP|nr:hypothetical protein PR048_031057 [Dryococelus australis]
MQGAGETVDPRENPPTSGIVWHDSHMRKSGSNPTRNRTRSAWVGGGPGPPGWEASSLTTTPPRPLEWIKVYPERTIIFYGVVHVTETQPSPMRCRAASRMLLPLICLATVLASATRTLAICPTSCKCDDDTLVVTCVQANLDVIPITLNPSIQRLVLRGNRVKTVDAAFQFYSELQYVDLSDNQLVTIPTRSFEAQRKLVELHLYHNRISSISNHTFVGLRALTVLSLRRNFLEEFPDQLFSSLSRLEELDLGQNRISRVDPRAFTGLASLKILYLDDNQLKAVPTPSFALLGSLAELHIGLNGFSQLPDDTFAGLGKLAVLDLSGAGLINISEHAFRGLAGLRYLGLVDNSLSAVPTSQLSSLSRLEELNIGQNDFPVLRQNAFKGLTNLRKLDISGAAMLQNVEKGALADNLNLETLILSSNKKLTSVEEGSLAGLPNLRHLVLRDNAFTVFPETLATWPELRKLDLADNPLECRCGLVWLRDLLSRRNATQVLCMAPPHLKERPLPSLSKDELGCALHDTRRQAIIGALCGSGVALLAVLGFLTYRYRRRFQAALKDYKWNNRAISRKEHEYQKTFSDEDYILELFAASSPSSAAGVFFLPGGGGEGRGRRAQQASNGHPCGECRPHDNGLARRHDVVCAVRYQNGHRQ